jgi:hypothetical protein
MLEDEIYDGLRQAMGAKMDELEAADPTTRLSYDQIINIATDIVVEQAEKNKWPIPITAEIMRMILRDVHSSILREAIEKVDNEHRPRA